MESKRGVQFTTWQWTYDHDGLTLGHYFGNDYAAAKQNFALRSGLMPEEKQFTAEQLIEIYRCCADTISHDYELSSEQEKRIDDIQTLITEMVPDYADKMKTALESDLPQQIQPTM
jgi:lipase chaperone LimK